MLSDNHSDRESTASPENCPLAWLVVVAAFLASFVVFGVIYSFGVFLRPMAAEFGTSAAATSAFFSITAAIFYSRGALTGGVADRFEPRVIVAAGAVVLGTGLCVIALANQVWLCSLAGLRHRRWYWRRLLCSAPHSSARPRRRGVTHRADPR